MQVADQELATWSDRPLDRAAFLRHARAFHRKLDTVYGFDELHALWQKTRLPYRMEDIDPRSPEYVNAVKSLYAEMAGEQYELLNEMSSTTTNDEDLRIGFPWSTGRLDIISAELAKVVQALRALNGQPGVKRVIEFGAGWGNLALPMGRSGLEVTAVDIDVGYLDRISRQFERADLSVCTIHADFLTAAKSVEDRYDAAIFQASFHHCLEFDRLIGLLRERVLKPEGIIYFFSEPVFENYEFPWGLRFDGESLWAIMKNKWLELGFDRGFFSELMSGHGLFLAEVPPVPGIIGCGFRSVPATHTLPFEEWVLPQRCDATFYPANGEVGQGRFCRRESVLPRIIASGFRHYDFTLANLNNKEMGVIMLSDEGTRTLAIPASGSVQVSVRAEQSDVRLSSDLFVPAKTHGNGDTRELGASLVRISCR